MEHVIIPPGCKVREDCIPANPQERVCELLGGPDSEGRYSFLLYWLTDYIPGQPAPPAGSHLEGAGFFRQPRGASQAVRGKKTDVAASGSPIHLAAGLTTNPVGEETHILDRG